MPDKIAYIGVDEVGRGAILGPVTCAGVLFLSDQEKVDKVRDSKTVGSEKVRGRLAAKIRQAHIYHVADLHAPAIDQFGIDACQNAASQACVNLLVAHARLHHPDYRIVVTMDGHPLHNDKVVGDGYSIRYVPKADATEYEVSAASLVAKVHRDTWVHRLVEKIPDLGRYNLDVNKGYGSCVTHQAAIRQHGLTSYHRLTFCRKYTKEVRNGTSTTAA